MDIIAGEMLALIDEGGVADASMRRVAKRLGVPPMTLYRHVRTRDELMDAVVEHIVNELDNDSDVRNCTESGGNSVRDSDAWRCYLDGLGRGVRRYALAHPHAFPLVANRPAATPWMSPPLLSPRRVESLLATLLHAGFTQQQTVFTYHLFNGFLLGSLLLETGARVELDPCPGPGLTPTEIRAGSGSNLVDATDSALAAACPARTPADQQRLSGIDTVLSRTDPTPEIAHRNYPVVRRLHPRMTEDRFGDEFAGGLNAVLDQVAQQLSGARPGRTMQNADSRDLPSPGLA